MGFQITTALRSGGKYLRPQSLVITSAAGANLYLSVSQVTLDAPIEVFHD